MSWFRRPSVFEDPQLGCLTRSGDFWHSAPPPGTPNVCIEGDRERPDPLGITHARQLLDDARTLVPIARAFVENDPNAQSFIKGHGTLEWDGFSVMSSGEFAVNLSLADWPDAMISVRFVDGAPSVVDLAD